MLKNKIVGFTSMLLSMYFLVIPRAMSSSCEFALSEEAAEPIINELCSETFSEIDRVQRVFNLGGGQGDEELERLIAILNTFDSSRQIDIETESSLLNDAGKILVERPSLRKSLKKNLVLSLFNDGQIRRWCRWLSRGKSSEYSQTNQEIVEKIEKVVRCGINSPK